MSKIKMLDWLFPHRVVLRSLEETRQELEEIRVVVARLEMLSRARIGRVARNKEAS